MRTVIRSLVITALAMTFFIPSAQATQVAYDEGYTGFEVPLAAYNTFATDLNQTFYYVHFGPSVLRVRPPYTQSDGRSLLSTAAGTYPADVSQIAPHPTFADTVFVIDSVTNVILKVEFTFNPDGSINPTVSNFINPNDIPNLHTIAVAFEGGFTKVFATGTDPGGNGVVYLAQDTNFNGTATEPGELNIVAPAVTAPGVELRGVTLATPFSTAAPLFTIDALGTVRIHQDIAPQDGTYGTFPPERGVYANLGGGFRMAAAYDSGHLFATVPAENNGNLVQSSVYEMSGDNNFDFQADTVTEVADFLQRGWNVRDLAFTIPFAPFGAGTFAGNFLIVIDDLNVPPSFPPGDGSVAYIQGRLSDDAGSQNGVSSGTPNVFFSGTDYEVSITFDSVSGGFGDGSDLNVVITTYDNRPPYSSGTKMLNRWWDIQVTPADAVYTADIVLTYAETDIPSGMTESEIEGLFSYESLSWRPQAGTVDTVTNTVTLNGVTGFSLWGIGSAEGFTPTVPSLAFWGILTVLGGLSFLLYREKRQLQG